MPFLPALFAGTNLTRMGGVGRRNCAAQHSNTVAGIAARPAGHDTLEAPDVVTWGRRMSKRIVTAATVLLVAAIGGATVLLVTPLPHTRSVPSHGEPVWTRGTWPFPIDQWGEGWAFQCKAADCGIDVNLYLRPKIGFCNCQTGVADDEELDRVSDIDLVGGERSARGLGRPIMVLGMKGRSRDYAAGVSPAKPVLSLAFNNRCDVIVATVTAGDEPAAQEPAVLEFLNGDMVRQWVEAILGL
jgi:hypothetical protein